jgi:hypothetical protein
VWGPHLGTKKVGRVGVNHSMAKQDSECVQALGKVLLMPTLLTFLS